jgi:hypothetical protein
MPDKVFISIARKRIIKKSFPLYIQASKHLEILYSTVGKHSEKINEISSKLNKAFHLVDKRNSLYAPEPIDRWEKERESLKRRWGNKVGNPSIFKQ